MAKKWQSFKSFCSSRNTYGANTPVAMASHFASASEFGHFETTSNDFGSTIGRTETVIGIDHMKRQNAFTRRNMGITSRQIGTFQISVECVAGRGSVQCILVIFDLICDSISRRPLCRILKLVLHTSQLTPLSDFARLINENSSRSFSLKTFAPRFRGISTELFHCNTNGHKKNTNKVFSRQRCQCWRFYSHIDDF